MQDEKTYYVYIIASISRRLYTGMTNSLRRRIWEHKTGHGSEFAAKYNINRLVHYENFKYVNNAISREKEIKDWTREKRLQLIEAENPGWADLAEHWFTDDELKVGRKDAGRV